MEEGETNESDMRGYPHIISYECTQTIMEQMKNNIFKVNIGEQQGTGFFCKIPFIKKDEMLPVLITNNHVINQDLLNKKDATITIKIKDKDEKKLKLNKRKTYTDVKMDVTIIEIKKEDEIKDFLQLDDKIINGIKSDSNHNSEYKDETIYIIQYPEGKLSVSYGIFVEIFDDAKHDFKHKCSTRSGSSGSPILNLENKVLGIHKRSINNYNNSYNKGLLLNYPIKEFIKKYNNSENKKKPEPIPEPEPSPIYKPDPSETLEKIKKEYSKLARSPPVNYGITVGLLKENNFYEWKCSIFGPKDTFYKSGTFFIKIKFPEDYPMTKPEIIFLTPIYHLNVQYLSKKEPSLGYININSLNTLKNWKSHYSIDDILPEIYNLFHNNNIDYAYDDNKSKRKNEFVNNKDLFAEKAKYFTKKYAKVSLASKSYPDGWDFTYK